MDDDTTNVNNNKNCKRRECLVSSAVLSGPILILMALLLAVNQGFLSFPTQLRQLNTSPLPTAASSLPIQAVRSDLPDVGDRNRTTTAVTVTKKINVMKRRSKLEIGLSLARASIRGAAKAGNASLLGADNDAVLIQRGASVYHNPVSFYQSYLEMEKRFKVYVYKEGDLPIVHDGPCKDIYTVEGRFIREMDHGSSGGPSRRFRSMNPQAAHVYFMPFSVTWMVKYLYKDYSFNVKPLKKFAGDYVRVISNKYPFWNRTRGADHFMLACHDWGTYASQGHPDLYNNSIRVLCNANSTEGFKLDRDVSLPEINLKNGDVDPMISSPPPPNRPRPHLAFFSGGSHGYIRSFLLHHWQDRDPDLRVIEYLPDRNNLTAYYSLMLQSKYCLCPSGYEVASPRIVEAIYAECVPVILSQDYSLPFSDVLEWESFSVQVNVSDIPRLKERLMAIPEERYQSLKEGLRAVRRHFELNEPAKRFDVFHMILHSIWLRRLNMKLE